jgi:hypothetical protein
MININIENIVLNNNEDELFKKNFKFVNISKYICDILNECAEALITHKTLIW